MRRIVIWACMLLMSGGAALAQTTYRPAAVQRAPSAAMQVDPIEALNLRLAALQSRIRVLENKVGTLQTTVSKTQPALTFRCLNQDTSINSAGVSETCDPFGCSSLDGRCRTTAKSSADCASGYSMSTPGGPYGSGWCVAN